MFYNSSITCSPGEVSYVTHFHQYGETSTNFITSFTNNTCSSETSTFSTYPDVFSNDIYYVRFNESTTSSFEGNYVDNFEDNYVDNFISFYYKPIEENPEARRRRIRQRIYNEKLQRDIEREKKRAESNAQKLLMELIGKEELELYRNTNKLLVNGNKYSYLLHKGGMVQRYNDGKVDKLCIHFEKRSSYPKTDEIIGLKLLVEQDEEMFNELANVLSTKRVNCFNEFYNLGEKYDTIGCGN